MVKNSLQPAQFQGSSGAVAVWRMECLAMEVVQGKDGAKFKAYMWSVLPGCEVSNVKNWSWIPVDLENMDDLQEACEAYVNTEEDQPVGKNQESMYRLLDLIAAGRKFLQSAMNFEAGMQ